MASRFKLPSGVEVTRASNGRGRGIRFEVNCHPYHGQEPLVLSEEDVAELANQLPVCARCGDFKLTGHDCPVSTPGGSAQ